MTPGTVAVLELLLAAEGQPMRLGDLVVQARESRPTVVRVIRRLEHDRRLVAGRDGQRLVYTLAADAVPWARQRLHERTLSASTRKRLRDRATAA